MSVAIATEVDKCFFFFFFFFQRCTCNVKISIITQRLFCQTESVASIWNFLTVSVPYFDFRKYRGLAKTNLEGIVKGKKKKR